MKKLKRLLLIFIAAFALALAGCGTQNGVPPEYVVKVTYCFNGGSLSGYSDRTELDLYYKVGSIIAEPGVSTAEFPAPIFTGYSIGGWYFAETDESGEVVRDENGKVIASDRKFDFKTYSAEKDIYLVVSWVRKIKVTFVNLYQPLITTPYASICESGQAFTQPSLKTSWVNGKAVGIEGYYWSYDEATDAYSDPVEFGSLTFDDLEARLPEEPETDGDYILFKVYVKLAQD